MWEKKDSEQGINSTLEVNKHVSGQGVFLECDRPRFGSISKPGKAVTQCLDLWALAITVSFSLLWW